jgi:hypothetical protein
VRGDGLDDLVKIVGLAPTLFALIVSLASCGPIDTRSCKILLDKKQQYELLERLRPVVEAKSSNGSTYPFEVQLERYEPVFRECSNFYEVKFEAIANPNSTTVFTGSDEQYLIYKTGNQVVGPLVFR